MNTGFEDYCRDNATATGAEQRLRNKIARAHCSSPPAGSAPDFTKVLQRMQHIMKAHPWWKKRIDGTPLATDLPVRAAVECCEIIRELMPN